MAVEKIFWQEPYLTELNAKVTSAAGNIITLDKTIAYAFSGGQQSDSGTINGFEILEAKKDGKEIFYTLPSGHNLQQGSRVIIKIDWDKRYKIMRLHFADELVLELINQHFNNPPKTGANITYEKARLDFIWQGNIAAAFPFIEEKLKKLIEADLPITSAFSDEESEKRYWHIKDFAKVPCGGTHLKRTGEIGRLKLSRKTCGKSKERIEITLLD